MSGFCDKTLTEEKSGERIAVNQNRTEPSMLAKGFGQVKISDILLES